jgi:4-amino-4-deoxy-L-arabinose transferase-like glycosyltransferase
LREQSGRLRPKEENRWFLGAYGSLALAFLAKGPLALVLSVGVIGTFLLWQRDLKALLRSNLGLGSLLMLIILAPWYVAAGIQGGAAYAYQMLVHQNLERALKAWDHIQPWWSYVLYLLHDFFPWSLLLPAMFWAVLQKRLHRSVATRFCMVAFLVPFLLLSCSQSKQSKYILMVYPFLAVLLGGMMQPLACGSAPKSRIRRLGSLLALGIWVPALAFTLVFVFHGLGAKVQSQVAPYVGPGRLCAGLLVLAALSLTIRSLRAEGTYLVREAAVGLALLFLVLGTWGFRKLDPVKGYKEWTSIVQPLLQGRQVYFWQTIRSGPMVYTDHLMPELHSWQELETQLKPGDRLVTMAREWKQDEWGMTPQRRAQFEVVLARPVGGGEVLLLKWKGQP